MSCEKCWADAYMRERLEPTVSQAEHYHKLLLERSESRCTPEQQCGVGTTEVHTILVSGKCACGQRSITSDLTPGKAGR